MPAIEEEVILGRDNHIVLELSVFDPLTNSQEPIAPIRCQVKVGATLLDSAVSPALFDLSIANRVSLKFGASSLTVGRYTAKLYLFFDNKPNGVLWDEFIIRVKQ